MNLPDLPRVLNQHEAKFDARLSEWLYANPEKFATSSMETKDTKGKNYLPFVAVESPQVNYAKRISGPKGAFIRVIGTDGQPDRIWMVNAPAWIVIRYPDFFCMISIGNWEYEKSRSKAKSLTSLRARQIATLVVEL